MPYWVADESNLLGDRVPQAGLRGRARWFSQRPSRLTVLVAIAIVAAVVAVAVNVSRGSGAGRLGVASALVSLPQPPLAGSSRAFTTEFPARWSVSTSFPSAGVTDYELTTSRGGMGYDQVLPAPGTVELQIVDLPAASVAVALGPHAASKSPLQLLRYGFEPRGAKHIERLVAPHRSSLAGLPAAGVSYSYTYDGRRDVQTALVSRDGGEIVAIQLDAAPALARRARSVLGTITSHWRWLKRSAEIRTPAAPTPVAVAPPAGSTPDGQWIASGFTSAVTGDVANARLDQPDVRAWYFTHVCVMATKCRTELVDQLMYGTTDQAQLTQTPGNAWWTGRFPATARSCARQPSRPTSRETITDTIQLGWSSPAHRELIADETETITGCGNQTPAVVGYHWTAKPVPSPTVPQITLNARHAPTAASFRSAAQRVCTKVNAQAAPIAVSIESAASILRGAASRSAKATAEATIARQLGPLLPLSAEEYTLIPQPPTGPLDALWLDDIAANRQQLAPGAQAIAALQAQATATSRYLRTGSPLALQTAVTEDTLYTEDITQLTRPATAGNTIEQQLRLPAVCINPPAVKSIFTTPKIA
jgi:hypothetical protein